MLPLFGLAAAVALFIRSDDTLGSVLSAATAFFLILTIASNLSGKDDHEGSLGPS